MSGVFTTWREVLSEKCNSVQIEAMGIQLRQRASLVECNAVSRT